MRRFSWFVLVKCVDYPIRMRHFSSRAIALGANFANKEIGRFTKSGSSMEEEKHKKPLLSYEEVIEVIDERISRDEPATADERIKRVEEVAEQMEEERKKEYRAVRRFLAFSEILDKSGPIHQKVFR